MTDRQADPELWALILALHDHCRRRNIELVAAARPLGETGVVVSRVGCNASIVELTEAVRTSLFANDDDQIRH